MRCRNPIDVPATATIVGIGRTSGAPTRDLGAIKMLLTLSGQSNKSSYRINDPVGKPLQISFTNEGDNPVRSTCRLLKRQGLIVSYFPANSLEDDWRENAPPLMPVSIYSVEHLRQRESCAVEHDVPTDVLRSYLADAGGSRVEIGIDVKMPSAVPATREWAGLGQKPRSELRP